MNTPRVHPAYNLEVVVTDDQLKRIGQTGATGLDPDPGWWTRAYQVGVCARNNAGAFGGNYSSGFVQCTQPGDARARNQ